MSGLGWKSGKLGLVVRAAGGMGQQDQRPLPPLQDEDWQPGQSSSILPSPERGVQHSLAPGGEARRVHQ